MTMMKPTLTLGATLACALCHRLPVSDSSPSILRRSAPLRPLRAFSKSTQKIIWAQAVCSIVLDQTGPLPTLIEWDNDLPDWPVLMADALRAQAALDRMKEVKLARVS